MGNNLTNLINYQLSDDIKQLQKELNDIIAETEDYYSLIYDNLPQIERNIKLTKEETEILIQYFIDVSNQQGGSEERKLISESLTHIENNLKQINHLLLDQKDINKILNLFLVGDDAEEEISFSVLLDLIEETTEVLEEVEIISLNAIIFSAKLEEQAQGFGVISNNIHNISLGIEKEFLEIGRLIDDLAQWHNEFRDNISNIANRQDEIAKDYINRVDGLFSDVTESVQGVNLVLTDLLNNVIEVVNPFEELMALIQGQDIIRQNLENISKSLEVVNDKHNKFLELLNTEEQLKKEDVLNYIYFINQGTNLLEKLGENAFGELFKSLDEIVAKIDKLLVSLKEVSNDTENLTNYFSSKVEDSDNGLVDNIFADVFNFSAQFIEVLSEIKDLSAELNQSEIEEDFSQLETKINNVNRQLDRLNKVEVLARIELARLDTGNNDFGAQIESVVDNVSQAVSGNTDSFLKLKKKLIDDLDEFDQIMAENRKQISQGLGEVEVSLEELKVTNDIINQAVLALFEEIKNLEAELKDIYNKLKSTDSLRDKGADALELIKNISQATEIEKNKFFSEFGVESWQLSDDDLKEIESNLTTFLEIKTIDSFLNETKTKDTIEDVSEVEGELTLF